MYQFINNTTTVSITLLCLMISFCSVAKVENDMSADFKNDLQVALGEKSPEHQAAMVELGQWQSRLNEFLMASGDDFTQAMVVAHKMSNIGFVKFTAELHQKTDQLNQINDLSYQPIADLVNSMIAQPKISPAALNTLSSVCAYTELLDHCHSAVLLQKRIEQDGENIQTYFSSLQLAIDSNRTQNIEQVIKQMANSTHSYLPFIITQTMDSLIDEFIATNSLPQSAIDSMVADSRLLSGVSAEKKAQLETLMPDYMPSFIKANYYYLYDLPAYRTLMDYCKTHASAFEACLTIAETLQVNSNIMIDKIIGHKLLVLAYESIGNQAEIDQAQQQYDQYKASYECITDLLHGDHSIDNQFDPEFLAITHNATDEYQMMKDHAQLHYRNLTAQGDANAIDPNTCYTAANTTNKEIN